MLIYIILATFIVSLISLVSIIFIINGKSITDKFLKNTISFASGILLGVVFIDIYPELFNEYLGKISVNMIFYITLASILFFYIIERIIHWHHCHGINCPPDDNTHIAYINLIGDGIHNIVDGVLIAAAFLISPVVGISTTLAVIVHEIPQEISDAGILLYAGLSKLKIVLFNLIFGLSSVLGGVLAYYYINISERIVPYFLAIAAGNFIYLALADLMPELHHNNRSGGWARTSLMIVGVLFILVMKVVIE